MNRSGVNGRRLHFHQAAPGEAWGIAERGKVVARRIPAHMDFSFIRPFLRLAPGPEFPGPRWVAKGNEKPTDLRPSVGYGFATA